jgi:hypothetical protein
MRKLWMALVALVALSVGLAWAEAGGSGKAGMDCSGCCCTAQSCAK